MAMDTLRDFAQATLFDAVCCGRRVEITARYHALPAPPSQEAPGEAQSSVRRTVEFAPEADTSEIQIPSVTRAADDRDETSAENPRREQTGGSSSSTSKRGASLPLPFGKQSVGDVVNSVTKSRHAAARAILHRMKDTAKLKLGSDMSALAAYVPSAGLSLLKKTLCMPKPLHFQERGVAAIFDLSGFTKMCADLSRGVTPDIPGAKISEQTRKTQVGVLWRTVGSSEVEANASETVKKIIDEAFSTLIDVIVAHGGDILRIAGDALIVMFTPEVNDDFQVEDSEEDSSDAERDCVRRAAQCAHKCVEISRLGEIPMQVHIGMSFGTLRRFHVGGAGVWQVVVAGEPMLEAGTALDLSSKLQTVVSPSFWHIMEGIPGFRMTPLEFSSDGQTQVFSLLESAPTGPHSNWMTVQHNLGFGSQCAEPWTMKRQLLQAWKRMPEIAKRALRAYVPDLVLQGTVTGLDGSFAEIRKLTCVFIDIELDLCTDSLNGTLKRLQDCFLAIHRIAVVEYSGSVKELTCDDKGLVCVIAFGLTTKMRTEQPETPKQADAPKKNEGIVRSAEALACVAASRIETALSERGVDVSIGIANGMVYCAALGNSARRELAMVSQAMNTAARLMSAVKKGKLVDMRQAVEDASQQSQCMQRVSSLSTRTARSRIRMQRQMTEMGLTTTDPDRVLRKSRTHSSGNFGSSLDDDEMRFSERILCTEDVQIDAGGSPGLRFHELGRIPLKGYTEPVPVFIIGAATESGDDNPELLMQAVFSERETDKASDAFEDDSDSKFEPDLHAGEVSLPSWLNDGQTVSDNAAAWRDCHRISETPITYGQYCTLLPAYFGSQEIQQELSDFIWIRSSGGSPSRVAELVRAYKEMDIGKADSPMGCWALFNPGFPSLVEIASAVPGRLAQRLYTGVSELSPLNQLVFKVIAVLGGNGTSCLIRHLLQEVTFLSAQWKELCAAFHAHYHEYHGERIADKKKCQRMSLLKSMQPQGGAGTASMPATAFRSFKRGSNHRIVREEVDVLVAVLADLEDHNLIEMDGAADQVSCNDFLLIDAVYSNLTFEHRKAIHEVTAKFLRSSQTEVEGVISLLPNIIHHTMLSQQESKAAALVGVAKNFASNDFLGHFIRQQVQWYLPLAESSPDEEVAFLTLRAEQTLPAIPSLRGLAKAMHQQLVGAKVGEAIKRFQRARKAREADHGSNPDGSSAPMA